MPDMNGNKRPSSLSWRARCADLCKKAARTAAAALILFAVSSPVFVGTQSEAAGETRSLKLYFVHTGEKAIITYKRNGKFDPKGLEQLNRFLRDWRKNQPTKMDPRLFDLIWEVYRQSGSSEYINVVCGFRSPSTNAMLKNRSRNSGVAEKSQHMLGKAMDFFIPDVKLAKLREIGMKLQVGGVGFYPRSGSPFVHMDVGGVRSWPRMSRDELVRLFPNGNTLHLPADGKPLPGYDQAVADYKRRVNASEIEVASSGAYSGSSSSRVGKSRTLLSMLFGGGGEDDAEDSAEDSTPSSAAPVAVARATPSKPEAPAAAPAAEPAEPEVASIAAPIPQVRPAFAGQPAGSEVATALAPSQSGNAAQQALAAVTQDQAASANQQFADLSSYRVPVPSLINRRSPGDAEAPDPQLAAVPVPADRPELAEKLLAAADVKDQTESQNALKPQQGSLSPAMVTAMANEQTPKQETSDVAMAIQAAMPAERPQVQPMPSAQPVTPPQPATPAQPPMQVAALAPSTKSPNFGDAFDMPKEAPTPLAQGMPAKGGRPTEHEAVEAEAARATVRGEPKLTEKMISQWALTNARMEMVTKPVKAPRFVSSAMRAQPKTVYAEGFTKTASFDPARFSGSAVNFMEVRKFNTN
ncbi:DUF882 domain-containing protein [Oryzifoliimicrobium ureilyticus]|uniref:DUF882 domain-containing protein n=1 Tax=Oryzifoliimicrobium ureilyticus TaxID=3113724 RepID=UPI0030763709